MAHHSLLSNTFSKGPFLLYHPGRDTLSELLQRLVVSMVTVRKVRLSPNVSHVKRECWMSKAAAELVPVLFDLIQKHRLNLSGNLENSEQSSPRFKEQ